MEFLDSFQLVNLATYLALNSMILFYAFPLWRRLRHRHLLFFCLSSFISIFVIVLWRTGLLMFLIGFPNEILYSALSGASSISNIFAGFAIYWMMQHYRRPQEPSFEENSAPPSGPSN